MLTRVSNENPICIVLDIETNSGMHRGDLAAPGREISESGLRSAHRPAAMGELSP